MVFSRSHVWIKSWTITKSECWRIDAFELWCWRRLLKVLWTAWRSDQSILKDISSEYSLEGLMLKLQYFGHLVWRADSLKKPLMLGKIEGKRRREWQRTRWFNSITESMDIEQTLGDSKWQGSLVCCSPWGLRVGHDLVTEQQQHKISSVETAVQIS